MTKSHIAFALAGLGGFNAHGAGFLTAASHRDVVPDIITATSGQIAVLAAWLQGKDLEKLLVDPALTKSPLAQLAVAFAGDPGVFRPAYQDAIMRWWTPPRPNESPVEAILNRLAPAQVYVPTRDPADFDTIAETLNNAEIDGKKVGIVFNAYNLKTGQAVLFGNAEAHRHWPEEKSIRRATQSAGAANRAASTEPKLQRITADAVRSCLWLSLYGFEHLPQPDLVDGVYLRSCIVAELHKFDRIFVARPLAEGWLKRPPANWFEVQDWQTEMWFSASYKAEVSALHNINGLVSAGHLGPPFKVVDLIEIAPNTPAGFFNYFIERKAIFTRAFEAAVKAFDLQLAVVE